MPLCYNNNIKNYCVILYFGGLCMEIQYNVIKVADIHSFINIHNRKTASSRQVCFVRFIGAKDDLSINLNTLDEHISCSHEYAYLRITKFDKYINPDDIKHYISEYDKLNLLNSEIFQDINDKSLSLELAAVYKSIRNDFKHLYPNFSDSMIKNTIVMLLFWTDKYLKDLLLNRDTKYCKLICSGEIGYREYAFCFLAATLGIDVMLLLPEGDLELPTELLEKSLAVVIGECRKYSIPEFIKKKDLNSDRTSSNPPKKNLPPKKNSSPIVSPQNNVHHSTRKELSFEELAKLAESVVMITVYDRYDEKVATGSGIVISSKGFILTNCHVVQAGAYYSVRFENDPNSYFTHKVIKYHDLCDLAILQIDKTAKPLKLYSGQEKLQRGQKVVAIGSPLGLFNSVSDGIISGFREINDTEMIQFTAPISHGSSGGAVLNMYGELIGISTAGIDGGQNINLAIPYDQIKLFSSNFI